MVPSLEITPRLTEEGRNMFLPFIEYWVYPYCSDSETDPSTLTVFPVRKEGTWGRNERAVVTERPLLSEVEYRTGRPLALSESTDVDDVVMRLWSLPYIVSVLPDE